MHTKRQVLMSVLLAAASVLGVFVWAEARSSAMFSDADFRDAKRALQESGEETTAPRAKERQEVIRNFERVIMMHRSAYRTMTYCGVGIVLVSMAGFIATWFPAQGEAPHNSLEATPVQHPPAAPTASPGANR